MFVVNLAISDLVMMTTQGVPVILNGFMQRYWMWGKLWCDIYAFTGAVTGTCSILSMVVIGYDRYIFSLYTNFFLRTFLLKAAWSRGKKYPHFPQVQCNSKGLFGNKNHERNCIHSCCRPLGLQHM